MELVICSDGSGRCIYSEELDLAALGQLSITRASHVEPTQTGKWLADLSLVDGPLLGPFDQRSAALAAEFDWLTQHWLVKPV